MKFNYDIVFEPFSTLVVCANSDKGTIKGNFKLLTQLRRGQRKIKIENKVD